MVKQEIKRKLENAIDYLFESQEDIFDSDNFLVIEVKYRNQSESDLEKIRDHWFSIPLKYKFGATIMINDKDAYKVIVIKNID